MSAVTVDPGQMVPQADPDAARLDSAAPELSRRELQILLGASYGLSNGEIGRRLFVSEHTVKTHMRAVMRKLGARDRAHATRIGLELRLLTAAAPLRPGRSDDRPAGHPHAVPGFPIPTDWLPVPIPERPYTDGGHTPACILAPQCPCRRKQVPDA